MVTTKKSIRNLRRKTVVASSYLLCKTVSSKARGLMFRPETYVKNHSLIFEFDTPGSQGLHMFFVFYPIDVLFLDDAGRVVDIKRQFKPFTFYNSGKYAKYVIELPSGTIDKSKTRLGDELEW